MTYPAEVLRQDAARALRARRPQVVICSWPPPGNTFEREVFKTKSVQLYVAINSSNEHGSGSREAYRSQREFDAFEDISLGRLILLPELGTTVHVFRRIES